MQNELNELIKILSAEHKIYQDYLQCLIEQQEFLIQSDLKGIKTSIDKISVLAQKAMNMENGRRTVISRLSAKLGMNPHDVTVSKILQQFEGPRFEELDKLKDKILDTYSKVINQKTRNELLIDQSMNIIQQTMQIINDVENPQPTYDNPAAFRNGANNIKTIVSRTA